LAPLHLPSARHGQNCVWRREPRSLARSQPSFKVALLPPVRIFVARASGRNLLSNILRTNGRIASIRRLQFATAGFPKKIISSLLPQTKSGGIPSHARAGIIMCEVRIATMACLTPWRSLDPEGEANAQRSGVNGEPRHQWVRQQ
jgi:hypothetical protein